MKSKIIIKLLICLSLITYHSSPLRAQTPRSILDKAAAILSHKDGVTANFTMTNNQQMKVSGTVAVKGAKVHAKTPVAVVWFDGKTQWTYLQKNEEVSVTTPTAAQLQTINPYTFINMYKQGYSYTMSQSAGNYVVHLTATDKQKKIQEMFITVDKKSSTPTQVKLLQGKKWTQFDISNVKQQKLSDQVFRFSQKDFPNAEVIDLR